MTEENTVTEDTEKVKFDEEEDQNLVDVFRKSEKGKDELKKISLDLWDKMDTARELSSEYRQKWMEDYKLFMGFLEKKSFPWKDCANVNVPISAEGMLRLYARVYGAFFAEWSKVQKVEPEGEDDEAVARAIEHHGNWQYNTTIPDFKRQQARGVLMYLMGDVVCHSYWDQERRCNRHEMLTPDDTIRPFASVSVMPDFSDLPWIAKILRCERHYLESKRGYYNKEAVDEVLKKDPTHEDEPQSDFDSNVEEMQGIEKPQGKGGPFKLVQWEGWYKLSNQDRDRYLQIVMHWESKTILYMTIHEMPDWKERERYDRQKAELEEYIQMAQQYEMMQQQMPMVAPMEGMPIPELPPPPQPPLWLEEDMTGPEPMKKDPIYMYRHAVCIEPLLGNLGNGPGRLMADYNRAANTVVNQFVDQATANNAKGFIADEHISFPDNPGGKPVIGPGRWNKARVTGLNMKDHIHEFTVGPANPQMMELVKAFYNWGQSAGQSPEILSGAPGKSGETWRGVSTRVEQANKQVSVWAAGYADFLEGIMQNNAKLNAMWLDDEELFWVNDHYINEQGELQSAGYVEKVTRAMYTQRYRFRVTADLSLKPEAQRIADKDEMVQNAMMIPMLANNWPFMYEVIKEALIARGKHDLVKKLPAPNTPPPMPQEGPGGPSGAGGPAPTGQANEKGDMPV